MEWASYPKAGALRRMTVGGGTLKSVTYLQVSAALVGLAAAVWIASRLRKPRAERIGEKWRRELADALAEGLVLRVEDGRQCTAFSGHRMILLDDDGLFFPRISRESVPYAAVESHGIKRAEARRGGWILRVGCGEGAGSRERTIREEEHARHADWLLEQALADLRPRT